MGMSMHSGMMTDVLGLLPATLRAPKRFLWSSYDPEADVLYINFSKPAVATDSELTDDIIIRYDGDEIVGYTILHASERRAVRPA